MAALRDAVARLDEDRASWSAQVREQYDGFSRAVAAADPAEAARALVFLRNVLLPTPAFQEGLVRVSISTALFGEPFERFLALAPPSATPSPPDEAMTFSLEPMGASATPSWTAVLTASLNGSDAPAVFAAAGSALARIDGQEASLPAPAAAAPAVTPQGLLALDWNHDFRIDLLAAGDGGLRLLLQGEDGTFSDATAIAMGAGADPFPDVFGAWAADVEMDGDLDVIVGIVDGAPLVLRNNGDGTWRSLRPFGGRVRPPWFRMGRPRRRRRSRCCARRRGWRTPPVLEPAGRGVAARGGSAGPPRRRSGWPSATSTATVCWTW